MGGRGGSGSGGRGGLSNPGAGRGGPPPGAGRGPAGQAPRAGPPSGQPRPSTPPAAAEEEMVEQLQRTTLGSEDVPEFAVARRNNRFGTKGRKTQLVVNYYKMSADTNLVAYHYDVRFQPEMPNKKKMWMLWQDAVQKNSFGNTRLIYDGAANAFSVTPLPSSPMVVEGLVIENDPKEKSFEMTIKQVATINISQITKDLELAGGRLALQVLDIAMRYHAAAGSLSIGRSLYNEKNPLIIPIDARGEIWKGRYQAVRPTQAGLVMNVDDAAVVMNKSGPMLGLLKALLHGFDGNRPLDKYQTDEINFAIRGLRVRAKHSKYGRQYIVKKLANVPASKDMFDCDGKQVSVVDYFFTQYRIKLQFPNLPCAKVGNKDTSMPLEMCEIVPGQRYMKALDTDQRNVMLDATSAAPRQRMREVNQLAGQMAADIKKDPVAKAFKLDMTDQMLAVEGRILDPPTIEYRDRKTVKPYNGSWNMKELKVLQEERPPNPGGYRAVCLVYARRARVNEFEEFYRGFQATLARTGVTLDRQSVFEQGDERNIPRQLDDLNNRYKPDIFLCLLDPQQKNVYAGIKEVWLRRKEHCETQLGLPSQCFSSKNVNPRGKMFNSPQYHANIALKVNVKLGGANSRVAGALAMPAHMRAKPYMIMGADVHHPPPADDVSPSIAAVVGSWDPLGTKYNTCVSPQIHKQREETIKNMRAITRELLKSFYRKSGAKPANIIMYRDGVGEGHFDIVMRWEVAQMKLAFEELEKEYQPKITYMIVQKRNRTRFFTTSEKDADKTGNMLAGTIIDSGACHPSAYDFFLCSHAGLKGTSKATHYFVMYDENNFSADEIQELTNSLCFVYSRCTRSVSVPTPAYYAHFAAYRTSIYQTPNSPLDKLNGKLYFC